MPSELPTKQTSQFTISVTVGSVVNILINIPMILLFGVVGSVIATVISELAVTCYQLFAVRKQISFKKLFSDWYKYVIAGLIMFGVVLMINIELPIMWSMLIIEILIGIIIYVSCIFIIKANVFSLIKNMVNNNGVK